ncbi:MAG: quinolinate synthase NadA [Brevinematales bacterium]
MNALALKILELKKKKNAYILAHNYQLPEIQDVADFVSDSLGLARKAKEVESPLIVLCGVYFMAETAKILNPDKKVLIPDINASCPLACFADEKMVLEWRKLYPDAAFVAYVNSTAKVKALVDICCTSSNAVKVVNSLDAKRVVFLPDKNLGRYVKERVDKEVILWPGYCVVHENVNLDDVIQVKKKHPGALIMAHPECPEEIVKIADGVCSTGQMFDFVKQNENVKEFIVVTEWGINHALKKMFPEKVFIEPKKRMECVNMKKITLEKLYNSLEKEVYEVSIDENISEKARISIEKMLKLS